MTYTTRKSWVLARGLNDDTISRQVYELMCVSRLEQCCVIGVTKIKGSIEQAANMRQMKKLVDVARTRCFNVLYVISIKHISENLDAAFEFMDRMNRYGVMVVDYDGYEYSRI